MKEKFKNTKGITLVALIITIIVLLILAVVAITSINNNKILEYAKNSKDAYNANKINEMDKIAEYEKYLEENSPNSSSFNFPYYGAVYSAFGKDIETDFYVIKKDKIWSFSTNWYGSSSENFGNLPETTYDDFNISEREAESYQFLDLNTAVDEFINNLPKGEESYENDKSWAESLKSNKNLDPKAILTESKEIVIPFMNNYQMIRCGRKFKGHFYYE